jgi:hypothetical protein
MGARAMTALPPGFKVVTQPTAAAPVALPDGFKVISRPDQPQAAPEAPSGVLGTAEQGMSGVNEGLANFLSLPNTAELGLRSIGPMIGNAFGGHFAMPEKSMLPDAGADYRRMADSMNAIKPTTDDPTGKFVRRMGQEVGANLIPSLGVESKVASVLASLGSGAGAATMEAVAPGNPVAEFAGQMIGGGVPLGIGNAMERGAMKTAAPTVDELRASKTAAYKAVEQTGVQYSPKAVDSLVTSMETAGDKINPLRHPKAASMLDDVRSLKGQPQSLTQVDELRQTITRDLIKSADGGERHWGYELRNALDKFVEGAGAAHVTGGDPVAGSSAMNVARALNARYRKTEDFTTQMTKAEHQAGSTASGGNINNAIREKARQILDSPSRRAGYSADELATLEKLVMGGKGDDVARLIGKLAPGGNGLMTALHTGAVIHNPAMAVVPVVAQVAKHMADRGTINRSRVMQALLARGGNPQKLPALAPKTAQALEALLAAQAANQNDARLARAIGQ